MIEFTSIADRIHVARTQPLDLNVSLVIGDATALVIDTRSTDAHAEELLTAIRGLTPLPLTVLNTHYHFDHTYGNAVIASGGRPIWAHPNAAGVLRDDGERLQADWVAMFRESDPGFAADIAKVKIQIPDHVVRTTERLDLGGRSVTISYHGRGHTDGDLVTVVDDADVIFAGDLLEEGAPPGFGDDSYPLDWPQTVAAMLARTATSTVLVPGHGGLLDAGSAERQHTDLAAFAWLIREGHADGASIDVVAAKAPWPGDACRDGVLRGYEILDDPVAS